MSVEIKERKPRTLNVYLTFQEARLYVQAQNLKSKSKDWENFCKIKPDNIPAAPHVYYRGKGWKSWADFLGTKLFHNHNWRPFKQAKKLVRELNITNKKQWEEFSKSGNRPDDIPGCPDKVYKRSGDWISWPDWFGTKEGIIVMSSFEEAQTLVRELNIKTSTDYRRHIKNKTLPLNLPKMPERFYKEWKSWPDFLGNENFFWGSYLPYDEAHALIVPKKLKSLTEYAKWCKSDDYIPNIPKAPWEVYKNKGWTTVGNYLGSGRVADHKKRKEVYYSYDEAKKYLYDKGFSTRKEYLKWHDDTKCEFLPKNPDMSYKLEWESWPVFLNTTRLSNRQKSENFLPFEKAREFAWTTGIKNTKEWNAYSKSRNKPSNIPANPQTVYKKWWLSWDDWFGTKKGFTGFLPYNEAEKFVHSLKIISNTQWYKYCRSGDKPNNIPTAPNSVYKNKGWISWSVWLNAKIIATNDLEYLPYIEAQKHVAKLKLNNREEYFAWWKLNQNLKIPRNPDRTYKDSGWVNWFQYLDVVGSGMHQWTKAALILYLKNAESDLNSLDPIELLTIINSNNLARKINQLGCLEKLISSEAHTELRRKALAEITEKIEVSTDFELGQEKDDSPFLRGEIKEAEKEETVPTELIPFNPIQDLKMVDSKSITVSLDAENIEFLIKYRLNKLWNHVLNTEVDLQELQNENGGHNFELIKKIFFEEYNAIRQIKLPDGYNFRTVTGELIEPNLMQKLTVHRLLRDKSYGNWTDTGGGKTLAAILAGRNAGANHTLIICNNATVEGWVKSINDYFIDNNIFVKHSLTDEVPKNIYQAFHKYCIHMPDKGNNYVVLNYETFQQDDGEYIVSELLKNNKFDYIILDEVQNVKQRDIEKESNRRNVVSKLLNQARTDNSELLTLAMTATPVINNLFEARMLIELLTGVEHKELNTYENIPNGVEMYKALTRHGLRYIPKYGISVHEEIITIDGSELQDKILNIRKGDMVGFEKVLLLPKLDAVKNKIRKGTLIYTHYVTELIPIIQEYVENLGYSVGIYSGDEKSGLSKFKKGHVDILIGSSPVGTGVDGIQKICNTLIPVCLPWTNSEWRQIKGRIDRQGSHFKKVNIYIPQVVIPLDEGKEWSWDKKRFNIIRYKATLADLAVDGRIPDKLLPSKAKMLEDAQKELREWVQRLESGNLITFERSELQIPLNPELVKKEQRVHGDFSRLNQRWSVSKSSTTYERLQKNQDEWYYYHTLYSEKRKTWSEIPYIEISKKIQARPDWVVGDFGCGENLLAKEVKNKVHAFDFVAVDDSVTTCDISQVPLKDNTLDVAVFSLSLMGDNYKDFLNEAYRVLKPYGNIFVAEPAEKWLGREHELKSILEEVGFKCHRHEKNTGKFIYLDGVKY